VDTLCIDLRYLCILHNGWSVSARNSLLNFPEIPNIGLSSDHGLNSQVLVSSGSGTGYKSWFC